MPTAQYWCTSSNWPMFWVFGRVDGWVENTTNCPKFIDLVEFNHFVCVCVCRRKQKQRSFAHFSFTFDFHDFQSKHTEYAFCLHFRLIVATNQRERYEMTGEKAQIIWRYWNAISLLFVAFLNQYRSSGAHTLTLLNFNRISGFHLLLKNKKKHGWLPTIKS